MKPRFVKEYTPPKLDARLSEAVSMMKHRPHMRNITPSGLRSQFNLRIETAQAVYDNEVAARANDLG